ncbi:MAG: Uma2 family endonuclease [Clostridiales bacterium]|nr:Uma2 family endonuclease [Clostridiales bacterium]
MRIDPLKEAVNISEVNVLKAPYKVEVISGLRIVMMSEPALNHDIVVSNLQGMFYNFLRGKICRSFVDGVAVHLLEESGGKGDNVVVPDAFILCDRRKWQKDGIHGTPDLIVEVLSPSTKKNDRGSKKDLYEKAGVKEYWLVDPDIQEVEVYLLNEDRFQLSDVYRIPKVDDLEEYKLNAKTKFNMDLFSDFEIDLRDIFEDVVDWNLTNKA